ALIRVAAANVERGDFAGALTGPAARGEVETVTRHLEALSDHPREARIYRELTDAIIHALEQRSGDTPVHAEVLRVVQAAGERGDWRGKCQERCGPGRQAVTRDRTAEYAKDAEEGTTPRALQLSLRRRGSCKTQLVSCILQ